MSQFQNQNMNVPQKFTDGQGNVNVAALAQGLQHLGGDPMQHQVGEGFNVEGLVAAYNTLESTKNQASAATQQTQQKQAASQIEVNDTPQLQTEEVNNTNQIDWVALSNEIQANGDILPATKQNLLKAGLNEGIIAQHVAGIKAVAENNIRKMAETIGGMENYTEFVNWANGNMSIEDRQSLFNQMNQPGGHLALQGAFVQFQQAGGGQGGEPSQIETLGAGGGTNNTQGMQPFQNKMERHAAFSDPRYGRDTDYTAQVQARVRITHAAVQQLKVQPTQ